MKIAIAFRKKLKNIYEYDENNNQIKSTCIKNGVLDHYTIYEYDENGNKIKETEYDKNGNVID